MDRRFWQAIAGSTALQVAMVLAGHVVPAVAAGFAPGGMAISAFSGWVSVRGRAMAAGPGLGLGALAGGSCALIGIAVSWALGDVPASLLALGTASSAVTGAIGGLLGRKR